MRNEGKPVEEVLKELEDLRTLDMKFDEGRIFGSMCTQPLLQSVKADEMYRGANLGNPGLNPGTLKVEGRLIAAMCALMHGGEGFGHVTTGGTESNITALWIARKFTKKREVIIPKSAHFSLCKAVDLLGLKRYVVDLDEMGRADLGQIESAMGSETAAVVGIAGTTELGAIDPIPQLSEMCGEDVFLHVDAAFGGFVIPFLKKLGHDVPDFDFSLPNVNTISVDPHKMGCSTVPAGTLLVRRKEYIVPIEVDSPYLTLSRQASLSGTRDSAAVAAAYAAVASLGVEGYTEIVKGCMDVTEYLMKRMGELGVEPVMEPTMNIAAFKVSNAQRIVNAMEKKGWNLSKSRHPCALRFVLMPHLTVEHVGKLMPELEATLRELGEI